MADLRPIELTPRLLTLARQVPRGARFADVGTDHARLPVWLLEQGVIDRAIATDLREGPLDRARQTASRHKVLDRIDLRLGDGLQPLKPGEADVIAVAGMGGETIAAILHAAPWTREGKSLLLLQPMTSTRDLRAWLWRSGYHIVEEQLVRDDRLYVSLTVHPGPMEPLTPAEEWVGRQWHGMDAPLRGEYLDRTLRRTEKALEGLRCSSREEDRRSLPQWEDLARSLGEMKKEWDTWQQ